MHDAMTFTYRLKVLFPCPAWNTSNQIKYVQSCHILRRIFAWPSIHADVSWLLR